LVGRCKKENPERSAWLLRFFGRLDLLDTMEGEEQ